MIKTSYVIEDSGSDEATFKSLAAVVSSSDRMSLNQDLVDVKSAASKKQPKVSKTDKHK